MHHPHLQSSLAPAGVKRPSETQTLRGRLFPCSGVFTPVLRQLEGSDVRWKWRRRGPDRPRTAEAGDALESWVGSHKDTAPLPPPRYSGQPQWKGCLFEQGCSFEQGCLFEWQSCREAWEGGTLGEYFPKGVLWNIDSRGVNACVH